MREEEYEMRERVKNRRRERIEEKDENYRPSRKERETYSWPDKQNHLIPTTRKSGSLRFAMNAWIISSAPFELRMLRRIKAKSGVETLVE